jgi:hypothetical protein
MPLVDLYQPGGGPGSDKWRAFWFFNWQDHWAIANQIQSVLKIPQTLYLITPWDQDFAEDILERHQRYHNDMNAAVGAGGQDLSIIDFNSKTAVQYWIESHYQEHLRLRQTLNIAD